MLHRKSNTHLFRMDLKRCCTHTLFSTLQYYIMAVTKMDSLCSLMLQDLKLYFISSKSSSHQCCQSCVPVQVYNCYSNFTNIRQKAWNAFVSWTTVKSSHVLLSAAVPLKQSPCTEHRHQSGRQSAYNLSNSLTYKIPLLHRIVWRQWMDYFFFSVCVCFLLSLIHGIFSINQVIL